MSLDACVHCDCLERRQLRNAPLPEWRVYVYESGGRSPRTHELSKLLAFDVWDAQCACEHKNGVLLRHRLGNISLIGSFGQLLEQHANELPVTLGKILYSGSHCGDWLSVEAVEELAAELAFLAAIHDQDPQNEQFLRDFEKQLWELVECARRVGKPIAF